MATPDLQSVAYPTLTANQIARVARATQSRLKFYPAGTTLFEVGARDFQFFIASSGQVEVIDPSQDPPRTLVVHQSGQFTGDTSHLTGSPAMVTAVTRVDSQLYEISADGLQRLLDDCPDVSDIILQAFIARRELLRQSGTFTGLRVIGSRFSRDTYRIREFLAKNRVLFTWLDLETVPDVNQLLQRFGVSETETPVVALGRLLLRNPSNRELADTTGIHRPLPQAVNDLVIVGAGPAGLAAAVYGASEGLTTVLLERLASGGQAGSSMRIENYLGFPTGLTGSDLADRAVLQARKFGAALSIPTRVTEMAFDNSYPVMRLDDGSTVTARAC